MQPIGKVQQNLVRKFLQIAVAETTCSTRSMRGLWQGFAGSFDHWKQEEVIPALCGSLLNPCSVLSPVQLCRNCNMEHSSKTWWKLCMCKMTRPSFMGSVLQVAMRMNRAGLHSIPSTAMKLTGNDVLVLPKRPVSL